MAAEGVFQLQSNKGFAPNNWTAVPGAVYTAGRNVIAVPVDLLSTSLFFRLIAP